MPEPSISISALDAELRRAGFRPQRPCAEPTISALSASCPACGLRPLAFRSYVAPLTPGGSYGHRGLATCEHCGGAWVLSDLSGAR